MECSNVSAANDIEPLHEIESDRIVSCSSLMYRNFLRVDIY